jgi:nucleoside-diphosphate-sugar epimerase
MPQTAFVTGATGFVGLNLIEELTARDWRVVALHRPDSDLRYLERFPVERARGDVTDPRSLARAMPERVDAVFHVAGDTSLWSRHNARQDRVNIDGTRHVVEAALRARARRLVLTSSISAWGMQSGRIHEGLPQAGGRSWVNYQRSKYLSEQEVRAGIGRGLDAVILNPASIFGPYDTASWAQLIRLIHTGRLPGVMPGSLSFCHAREVARAHVAAAERGRSGENYLLGGTDASFRELVRTVGEVLGRPVPDRVLPPALLYLVSRAGQLVSYVTGRAPRITPEMVGMATRAITCDSGKAQRELGFRTVALRTMVQDSVDWLRREGFLQRWVEGGR